MKNAGVGADTWRRTGILTFEGNRTVEQKATFSRIKEHLEQVYQRKFGYGAVVQLCVARNKLRWPTTVTSNSNRSHQIQIESLTGQRLSQ